MNTFFQAPSINIIRRIIYRRVVIHLQRIAFEVRKVVRMWLCERMVGGGDRPVVLLVKQRKVDDPQEFVISRSHLLALAFHCIREFNARFSQKTPLQTKRLTSLMEFGFRFAIETAYRVILVSTGYEQRISVLQIQLLFQSCGFLVHK